MAEASPRPWTPLHLKSHYSIGVGTAGVAELVGRLAEDGVEAAALTDADNLCALPRFHARCRQHGIRALTGVELTEPGPPPSERTQRERRGPALHPAFWEVVNGEGRITRSRVVLLARDHGGYETMCRLITLRHAAAREGGPAPAGSMADEPLLVRLLGQVDTDGLFVLTDDPRLATALRQRECVRRAAMGLLLVRPHPRWEERRVRTVAERLRVPLVADPEPTVLEPEDRHLHLLLRTLRGGRGAEAAATPDVEAHGDRPLPRPDEVRRRYADVPDALAEARRVAAECGHDLLTEPLPLPRPPWIAHTEAPRSLATMVQARLREAREDGRCLARTYSERLEAELDAIGARGLSGYFLVVAEILEGARKRGIPVAGRGSAVGSLVGHLLGLSPVDPVEAGLHFERFIHRRRSDLPDIDLDVSSTRREELISWTQERFGPEHVALACSFHRFGRRTAWGEGLAALGVPAPRVDTVLEALPPEGVEDDGAIDARVADLPAWAPTAIRRLIGRPRHVAAHPGGVVVAPSRLDGIAPVQETGDGRRILQYDAASLAILGLPKIDLLGSRALAEIEVAISLLGTTRELAARLRERLERRGPSAIPSDDPATLDLIDRADTLGVAELETPAVRAVLEQLPIRALEDVVATLALVRPGASAGRAKLRFVRRARAELDDRRERSPLLESVLRETHGVLLYEEDLMRVIASATGLDLEEADEVRRDLVALQEDAPALLRMEERFVDLAVRHGVAPGEAQGIWSEVARFAAYSFNKAHAAGHALLAYQGAFLRTHAPVAFACGVLDHHGGAYPPRTIASAITRWGVAARRPHVAHSQQRTLPEGRRSVRLGFGRVKGLSAVSSRRIVAAREKGGAFKDLDDFLARARPSSAEAAALLLLGSCDGLEPVDATLYPFLHEGLAEAVRGRRSGVARMGRELSAHVRRRLGEHEPASIDRYRSLVRVRNELRFLEMHLTFHPMSILRGDAEAMGCRRVHGAGQETGERVRVAALLGAGRRVPARDARRLRFLTLEDESGLLEAVLRPAVETSQGHRVTTPGPYLVEGVVRDDRGHPYLDVDEIRPFHWRSGASEASLESRGAGPR